MYKHAGNDTMLLRSGLLIKIKNVRLEQNVQWHGEVIDNDESLEEHGVK